MDPHSKGSNNTIEMEVISIEKKTYTTPELIPLGDVTKSTQGEGWDGQDDQWWRFHWGEDPSG